MNERLLEPLKYYETTGRAEHERNVTEYFDSLLLKSNLNESENRATAKAYRAEMATVEKLRDKISRRKTLRVFVIIFIVVAVICALVGTYQLFQDNLGWGLGLLLGGILVTVLCIVWLKTKINPDIKHTSERLERHLKKAGELLSQAEAQMAPLNALFDNTDTLRLIEKTMPEFDFDENFTVPNQAFFKQNHDFEGAWDENRSVVDTLSGRFSGNPFLIADNLVHRMGVETYHGTLVISWTETYRDSEGRTHTRHRTQTLYASVTKPKPFYSYHKRLYYGCQAAPDLSFSREPKHSERLSEKERERAVRKGLKKLKKKTEKATKKGGRFQEMANAEFDVLFGAHDRDHEVQFRLMYTPLAQCNTVDLLTSTTGYGDDFNWQKCRRLNILSSEHAQTWDMDTSPAKYYSYDVDIARRNFVAFNMEYFKSVFFDFAPLISVPVYQETPCASLEPLEEYDSHYTAYEHEVIANAIGREKFAHHQTATEVILKTGFLGKEGDYDRVSVTAYSYVAQHRVDFVPTFGGDGRMHAVPVPWVEYLPVENTVEMKVCSAPVSMLEYRKVSGEEKYNGAAFFHGMAGRIL